jgi:hypothetical protein
LWSIDGLVILVGGSFEVLNRGGKGTKIESVILTAHASVNPKLLESVFLQEERVNFLLLVYDSKTWQKIKNKERKRKKKPLGR